MLLRVYRVTDKLGIVLLKALAAALDHLALGLSRVLGGVGALLTVVLAGAGQVARRAPRQRASRAATAAKPAPQRRQVVVADQTVLDDPLRRQNRALSMLLVLTGFVLLGVVLWATNPNRAATPLPVGAAPADLNISFVQASDATPTQPVVISTAVPTATVVPPILQVRGSLAYVVREGGQTDLWAINVGESRPIRLTNSPQDERDPAWSPDGRRLAYASRQDGNWELYVYDLLAGSTTRLTYDLSFQGRPAWSPDGAYLVYESYQGSNLDLYVIPVDGSTQPQRITSHPAPDFSPAWSPDGRRIAFVSWRDGNQDIYLFSLDDPRDSAVVNITNSPSRHEDFPRWSPDGRTLAYSALDEGLEKVFTIDVTTPGAQAQAQVHERGRTPAWSPDGSGLVFAVDSSDATHLVASPWNSTGVATQIIPVPRGATMPVWTSAPLPVNLVNSGGLPPAVPGSLYDEQVTVFEGDPPYKLNTLLNVQAPNAVLSDRVNDSFDALRERTVTTVGYDFLGRLEDAFWSLTRPPQPGEERRNWHMTGRAIAFNRSAASGFPAPVELVREDVGVNTFWRVYVRVPDGVQNGQLGEPLRHAPWDLAARGSGDVAAYDAGGRLRPEVPAGYYVDFTQVAQDYGWQRMPAGSDWRANLNSVNYWLYVKHEGQDWLSAMRELYPEGQLANFAPRATAGPPIQITPVVATPQIRP